MCAYQEIVDDISRVMNFSIYYLLSAEYRQMPSNSSFFYEMDVGLYVFHSDSFSKDMIAPIWKSPGFLHIGYRRIYEQGATSAHIQPFKPAVWLVISFWILLSGIIILLTKYLTIKAFTRPRASSLRHKHPAKRFYPGKLFATKNLIFNNKLKRKFIITDHLFLSLDSFTNQCGSIIPKILTFRMVVIMTRIAPLLIIPVYSAAVLSFITVKTTHLPFEDIEGFVADGTFKIGYENNTFASSFFSQANDPVIKTAYEKHVVGLEDMPMSGSIGLRMMCKDRKFAFVYYNNDIYRYKRVCRILQIPTPLFVTWDAFALRINSPYKTVFNRILKTLRSAGVLKRLGKKVYGIKPSKKTDSDFDSVGLESVLLLFKVTASVYVICVLIFVFEWGVNHRT